MQMSIIHSCFLSLNSEKTQTEGAEILNNYLIANLFYLNSDGLVNHGKVLVDCYLDRLTI